MCIIPEVASSSQGTHGCHFWGSSPSVWEHVRKYVYIQNCLHANIYMYVSIYIHMYIHMYAHLPITMYAYTVPVPTEVAPPPTHEARQNAEPQNVIS